MAFSILGSGAAAILSRMSTHRRADAMAGLTRLLAILRETRGAEDEARLTELEAEADAILSRTLEHSAAGDLDEAGLSAYRMAMDQTTRGVIERRHMLQRESDLREI